jgi:hypothetical protein
MLNLAEVEHLAAGRGLLLRLKVRKLPALWSLRLVVARPRAARPPLLLGEMRGWALARPGGLHLDTLQVEGGFGVGLLIWAATFAWALEATPCRTARLLAIRDEERRHRRLVRYFGRLGFVPLREVGGGPADLPARLLWGGAGLLMEGHCAEGARRCAGLMARRGSLSQAAAAGSP